AREPVLRARARRAQSQRCHRGWRRSAHDAQARGTRHDQDGSPSPTAVTDPRRRLPSVDALLVHPEIAGLVGPHPRSVVVRAVRDALVVNNAAGGVLLALAALARDGEAIVSRGELVEIGGSFRIPDVMARSGARLVEVGTTNRTHLKDYEQALTHQTRVLLKVHRSNFQVSGFTAEVDAAEIAQLARAGGAASVYDVGSGLLIDLAAWGLAGEPTVPAAVASGVDLVVCSGDKL